MLSRFVLCASLALASGVAGGQSYAPQSYAPPAQAFSAQPIAATDQAPIYQQPANITGQHFLLVGASDWEGEAFVDPAQQPCPAEPPIYWDSCQACCSCGCCRLPCCECPEPAAPCLPCPRVNTINPSWNLLFAGNLVLDMLYNTARPLGPGTPFLLAPEAVNDEDTFDIHSRQTTFYAALKGPPIGNFEAGGLLAACLYDNAIFEDVYGFLPIQAFGELKNESWRFAGGLQMDIFAPLLPTVLPFSYLMASGNAGMYRGQLRAERFIPHGEDGQITITAGIGEATPTVVVDSELIDGLKIVEDNGWPNIELRVAWAVGPLEQVGLATVRPFEVGISGFVGQQRITTPPDQFVADCNGVALDLRWRVAEHWGFTGEVFTGQGLGSYGGGVFQSENALAPFDPVQASGGWGEVYFYLTPCLHTHTGYAIDNPLDADLALTQIARNETFFINLIWDVTRSFRLGTEVTFRQTEYVLTPLTNEGVGVQGQAMWKF